MTHLLPTRRRRQSGTWPAGVISVLSLSLVLVSGTTAAGQQTAAADGAAWTIEGRHVPAPVGASRELASSIASMSAPDAEQRRQNVPADDEAWRALQRAPHRKMRVAGVEAQLNVYEGLSHAEYMVQPDLPESQQVFDELGQFLRRHLTVAGREFSGVADFIRLGV